MTMFKYLFNSDIDTVSKLLDRIAWQSRFGSVVISDIDLINKDSNGGKVTAAMSGFQLKDNYKSMRRGSIVFNKLCILGRVIKSLDHNDELIFKIKRPLDENPTNIKVKYLGEEKVKNLNYPKSTKHKVKVTVS